MLDVHPPHEAAHTWKDFFIHIATIVLGLIIAVGLEQSVEWMHRRHEVQDLREALKQEHEENSRIYTVNVAHYRANRAILENDLRIFGYLQQHPGTPEEKLPGVPLWGGPFQPVVTSAWKSAQQTQALALLPRQESEDASFFYDTLAKSESKALDANEAVLQSGDYALLDPNPSHLTPAQIDQVIQSLKKSAQDNRSWSIWLFILREVEPDFAQTLTRQEIHDASGWTRSAADQAKLSAATAQTTHSLAATEAALDDAEKRNQR